MGNQQSSEEKKSSSSRSGTPQADKDRKVNRRTSIQALSQGRGTPVDAAATKDIAVAQTTSQHFDKPQLQQYLQNASPDSVKSGRVERSASRTSKDKRNDLEHRPRHTPPPQLPLAVSKPVGPMDVPVSKSKQDEDRFNELPIAHSQPYEDRRYAPTAQLRPPRLPLPIADVPTPDSPTLLPVDKASDADIPLFSDDGPLSLAEPHIRRRSSVLSTNTQSEDEVGEELQPYAVNPTTQTTATVIEWNHGGNKVYVTGTFANWEKKYRLHPRKNAPGMFTTINLPSGTHHLKFVVDGEMVTSSELPTAVDFNNFLVNYIEIATEDISKPRRESAQARSSTNLAPEDFSEQATSGQHTPDDSDLEAPRIEEIPAGDWRQHIPPYLIDVELDEDDPKYINALAVIQDFGNPPALPLFLSRSILNGTLPVKDDNSVLTLPNHTVLNHLMTSSVKNGVLATSVTTRYKKKYVTTISFKPVPKTIPAEQHKDSKDSKDS